MKNTKRLFCILMALLVFAIQIPGKAFLWSVSAEETKQFTWDFEHNNIAQLGTADGSDADGYYAAGDVSIVQGGASGSAYALKVSNADSGNGQWINNLKPNTEYEVTFYAKIANWGGAAYPHLGVNGYNGDAYVAESTFTEEWASYTLSFVTGEESTGACVYTWVYGFGAVDFYIDDVSVREISNDSQEPPSGGVVDMDPMKDWDFEHNNIAQLGTADGSDADGYYAAGEVSVVPGGANGSAYALNVSDADSGNGQWINNLKPDTDYEITFYAKIANWGGAAYPTLGVNGYDGDAYMAESTFTEAWASYNISFHTGKDSSTACIYTWIYGIGGVEFYVDEVVLKEVDEGTQVPPSDDTVDADPLKDWDFEHNDITQLGTANSADVDGYYAAGDVSIVQGGASGSAYALKVSNADSGNGQWISNLKPNTNYRVTFYAKISNWAGSAYPTFGVNGYDGDAYVAESNFGEKWARYSLSFRTGKDSSSACIYTWIYGSGEVDFYVDNVVVKEKTSTPSQPGTTNNQTNNSTNQYTNGEFEWNFEDNNISLLGTPDGADTDGYYAAGNVSVVQNGANETAYALKISNGNSGNGQTVGGLKSNTEYVVSFYAKLANWGGTSYPHLGVNAYDGDAYVSAYQFTEDWEYYTLTFKTGENSTSAVIYTWIYEEGLVDFYIDEVNLIEKALYQTPEEPVPTLPVEDIEQTTEPENTNSGEKVEFSTDNGSLLAKMFYPMLIIDVIGFAAILAMVGKIVLKKKS